METKKKGMNPGIEFFRLVFTVVILLHHASSFPGGEVVKSFLRRGYLCVEFFFLLSGYFLYSSFLKEKEHRPLEYVKKRLDRLYPEYLFAAVAAIFVLGVLNREFDLSKAVNELLMLQNTGPFHLGGYNFPCWYLSVMMVAGTLLYSILSVREKDYLRIAAPLLVVGGYTWLIGAQNGIEVWGYMGPVSLPLLRGLIDMSLGVLLCAFVRSIRILTQTESLLMEAAAVILIFLGMFTDVSGEMLTVVGFVLLILSLTAGENITCRILEKSRLLPVAAGYSYTLYLNHGILVKVFQQVGKKIEIPFAVPLYLLLLIIYSVVTKWIVGRIRSALCRRQKQSCT